MDGGRGIRLLAQRVQYSTESVKEGRAHSGDYMHPKSAFCTPQINPSSFESSNQVYIQVQYQYRANRSV